MEVNRREIFRYLGYGRTEPDERIRALAESCLEELEQETEPKCLFREYPLALRVENGIDGGCFQTVSKNLGKNLKDCENLLVFAATLGAGADLIDSKVFQTSDEPGSGDTGGCHCHVRGLLRQYLSGTEEDYEKNSLYLRPRFSPGYGDFPLENQKNLLDALEAGKRIGIKLTDSLLMTPSKSVTAVMGISSEGRTTVR